MGEKLIPGLKSLSTYQIKSNKKYCKQNWELKYCDNIVLQELKEGNGHFIVFSSANIFLLTSKGLWMTNGNVDLYLVVGIWRLNDKVYRVGSF